jgi:hypothetical protein
VFLVAKRVTIVKEENEPEIIYTRLEKMGVKVRNIRSMNLPLANLKEFYRGMRMVRDL